MTPAAPDFDSAWNFDHPAETEEKFRTLLAANEGADAAWRAEVLTQIARSEGLQRQFTAAHATLDRALALIADPHGRANVRYLLERGRVYNSSGQPRTACPIFVRALELARAVGEDNYAVDAAHMLGIADEPERRFGWNCEALDMAERCAEPRARRWRGSLHNNIGWGWYDAGKYDEALASFQAALACRIEEGAKADIRIAHWCIARTLRSLGRVDESLAMQRELLRQFEADGDHSGYVKEEIGECLLELNHVDKARPFFREAHAFLSQDIWLNANEPARLERLRRLGDA